MALGPKLWHKIKLNRVLLIIAALMVAVTAVLILTKVYGVSWTGLFGYDKVTKELAPSGQLVKTTSESQPGKTLWDWLNLLGVLAIPVAVGLGTVWFTTKQTKASEAQHEDQQQETALQEYLDKMSEFLLQKNLHLSKPSDELANVASVRTRTTLHRLTLDSSRKRTIVQFLCSAHLISILDWTEVDLSGANLSNINLSGANLSGANLRFATLNKADLSNAVLSDAKLSDAVLSGVNLSEAVLSEANLSRANLSGANLRFATLNEADLSNTNLSGAKLDCSKLIQATLPGADLSEATLLGADLSNADLSKAVLSDAKLSGAVLSGAIMKDAILDNTHEEDVYFSDRQIMEMKSHHPFGSAIVDTSNIYALREEASYTGTYRAALLATIHLVPVVAALLSFIIYTTLSLSLTGLTLGQDMAHIMAVNMLKNHMLLLSVVHANLPLVTAYIEWGLLGSKLMAVLGGTILTLILWLLVAIPYRRLTAVDRANQSSFHQLLRRLKELQALFTSLPAEPEPEASSLQTLSKKEVSTSLNAVYLGLTKKSPSWILGTGYANIWRLMHRIDEALIYIKPIEPLIYDAIYDEMSLRDSTLTDKDDLLNKLRRAVRVLNQQLPQDDQAKHFDLKATPSFKRNTDNPKGNDHKFTNKIDPATQARTIIYDVRTALNHFQEDRWDELVRVRNQLMKITLVTGLLLYALVEFAIMINLGADMLKAAAIFLVGGIVGLFIWLYDQSKTDTSIDDHRLTITRFIALPLYSGLAAIVGVLIVQRAFDLNVSSILIAAAFGLTPSLFTSAIQKEADQYKTDLKST